MDSIEIHFMVEKREGHGEDSCPLVLNRDTFAAIGVFDGMGGSGASICESDYGSGYTKAYVASRIVKEAIENFLQDTRIDEEINEASINARIKGRLEQESAKYPPRTISSIKSSLVHDYPTTMALVTIQNDENNTYKISSYWAGDSRNYLWIQDGFYQITKDDLRDELDPLENLHQDGRMSNYICRDREFVINKKEIIAKHKFIVLSATDGCFGYYSTPMHFPHVLNTCLQKSNSAEEWLNCIQDEILKVTGDDASFSLMAVGFDGFDNLKEYYKSFHIIGIEKLENLQSKIDELSAQIDNNRVILDKTIYEEWNTFKKTYLKYLNEDFEEKEDALIQNEGVESSLLDKEEIEGSEQSSKKMEQQIIQIKPIHQKKGKKGQKKRKKR